MQHASTRIAGAGLSGLVTAIGLAQAGQPAEIFEAAHDSGSERKGTWDAVENWTTETDFAVLLDRWKLTRGFEVRPVRSLEVYDPGGECHSIHTSSPLFYLVKRGNEPGGLEHALKEQAQQCGVSIHYNTRGAREDVDVWAVGAEHRGQFLGVGLRFQTHHPDTVKLLISTRHAPRAYAYLFIAEGRGILTVVLTRNFADARSYLEHSLEFFRTASNADPIDMENVHMVSGFGGRREAFWNHTATPLRVGEAAGFQDYLWGFGIRYALHSGYLAAQSIAQGFDYDQAVRTQIHPQIYTSLLNRKAYDRANDLLYRLLIDWFSRSPRLIEILRARYRVSIPNQMLWLLRKAHARTAVPTRHK